MTKRALILGVGGQDGAYLARLLVDKGYEVHGTSRDAATSPFEGLRHLGILDRVTLHSMSLADYGSVLQILDTVRPAEIYNLSAQSSVGLSFAQPAATLTSIANATLHMLEAIRFIGGDVRFYNASSSEMFGDTARRPADETTFFQPRSPYGVAKAAAHWLVQNYREGYGLYACSGILFNHESPLRHERFVTQKIVRAAVALGRGGGERLTLGNLDIVRDWGWAPEYVEAMWLMLQQEHPADFIVATGQATSLRDFIRITFERVGLDWRDHVDQNPGLLRPYEVDYTVGDATKAARELPWTAQFRVEAVVAGLVDAELERIS